MPLYNIDLEKRECIDERPVDWENESLDAFIECLRVAAHGLADPQVTVVVDDDSGDYLAHHVIAVSGRRPLTEAEVSSIKAERGRDRRLREHIRAFRG